MTRKELYEWIEQQVADMCRIPMCINGAGFQWLEDWNDQMEREFNEQYFEPEILQKGEEFMDFRYFMGAKMYKEEIKYFVRLPHMTGYNQENFDIQIAIY